MFSAEFLEGTIWFFSKYFNAFISRFAKLLAYLSVSEENGGIDFLSCSFVFKNIILPLK